jgi:hypothetical protein
LIGQIGYRCPDAVDALAGIFCQCPTRYGLELVNATQKMIRCRIQSPLRLYDKPFYYKSNTMTKYTFSEIIPVFH